MDRILKGSVSSQSNFIFDLLSSRYTDTEPATWFTLSKYLSKKPTTSHQARVNIRTKFQDILLMVRNYYCYFKHGQVFKFVKIKNPLNFGLRFSFLE